MRHPLLVCALVALSSIASAQVPVVQVRLTRTLPTSASAVVQASTAACNLPVGPVSSAPGLRYADPVNANRDCELLGTVSGVIAPRVPGTVYAYTLAFGNAAGEFTAAVAFPDISMPLAPSNPRIRPGDAAGVEFAGVIQRTYPYPLPTGDTIAVATAYADSDPDGASPVHIGVWSLEFPGYTARVGDRVWLASWRP